MLIAFAENKAGYSESSDQLEILAAESPSAPSDLTLEFFQTDDTIKATWTLGENNGAEISSNKVLVNQVEAVCTAELLI